MANRGNIFNIVLHLSGWGLYVLFNYLVIRSAGISFDLTRQLILLSLYGAVFYGFYFFIAPLLLKKRIIMFIISSVLVLTTAVAVDIKIQERYHFKFMEEQSADRQMHLPFPGDRGRDFNMEGERPPFPRRNMGLMNSALQVSFFLLISLLLRFVQKWQSDEKERYVLEKEKSDAELLFLKQQINPHFLFNSLNSIYSLANKKSDLTAEAILKLSAILRYILYNTEKKLVHLSDEMDILVNYIELHRLRITDKVRLDYRTEGSPEGYFIEPLLLMPIFENAFKFGIDSISESFINIVIDISDGELTLEVSNKIVPQKEKSDEHSGIGLKNIKRRLDLLYPDSHALIIDRQEQVFMVKLELRLKK